jgi:hypothetical protein
MLTTSLFDHDRRIEFYGGPWDGVPYTPLVGAAYPKELHMRYGGVLYRYALRQMDGRIVLGLVQRFLQDGASVK